MDDDWMDVDGCVWMCVDVGGALEEDWRRTGGGLEEDCRSLGGALEEDGPPKYGLGTPQYGDYVPTAWINYIFSLK